jgi:hypothetical protein
MVLIFLNFSIKNSILIPKSKRWRVEGGGGKYPLFKKIWE